MKKILIVEDEAIIRKGLRYGLDYAKFGCVVIDEAQDGQSAIQLIKAKQPDIIFMDINLPVKSGLEVLKETQEFDYAAIIISGHSDFEVAKKAISLNVVDYLLKPIEMDQLQAALNQALGQLQDQSILKQVLGDQKKLTQINLLINLRKTTDPLVIEILKFIDENYQEKFTINDLVKRMGYSQTHLMNKFKRHASLTFNSYLTRYRVMKAIEMMKEGISDIYILSDSVGFSDHKYFDQVFKKYIGYSVKEYQNAIQP